MSLNREKFVELMKSPEKISGADYAELEKLLSENPYFQGGHTVFAKVSRLLKKKTAASITQRAAIYATNRGVFKQYLLSQVKQAPSPSKPNTATKTKASPAPVQQKPIDSKPSQNISKSEQDQLIKEIYDNLEQWKVHRDEYLEFDKAHPEEIIIEDPKPAASIEEENLSSDTVEMLKSQVAEEVQAEDDIIEEVISKPLGKVAAKEEKEEEREQEDNKAGIDILKDAASLIDPLHKDKIEAEAPATPPTENTEVKLDSFLEADNDSPYAVAESYDVTEKTEDISEEGSIDEDKITDQVDEQVTTEDLISSEELSAIVDKESQEAEPEEKKAPEGVDLMPEDELKKVEHLIDEETGRLTRLAMKEDTPAEVSDSIDEPEVESVAEESVPESEEAISEVEGDEVKMVEPEEVEDLTEKEDTSEEAPLIEDNAEIEVHIEVDDDKTTEETEEELHRLDDEKKELKLKPQQSGEKKFRLSVMKRSIKFTKEKKSSESKGQTATQKPEPKKKTTAKKKTSTAAKSSTSTKAKTSTTTKKTSTKKSSTTKAKSTKSTSATKKGSNKASGKTEEDEKKKS